MEKQNFDQKDYVQYFIKKVYIDSLGNYSFNIRCRIEAMKTIT